MSVFDLVVESKEVQHSTVVMFIIQTQPGHSLIFQTFSRLGYVYRNFCVVENSVLPVFIDSSALVRLQTLPLKIFANRPYNLIVRL